MAPPAHPAFCLGTARAKNWRGLFYGSCVAMRFLPKNWLQHTRGKHRLAARRRFENEAVDLS
jgi:hypothetical protein